MTAATMAFLLAASAPFQAFAEEVNPDSSYSVDQERLTDNQLDYDEIGARVKNITVPSKCLQHGTGNDRRSGADRS